MSRFEQEPDSLFGLTNPVRKEARRGDVALSFTHVICLVHVQAQLQIVVVKFRQHIDRYDMLGVVVYNPLQAADVAD
jgi:hypothetical protein